jgi:hypothetical protein
MMRWGFRVRWYGLSRYLGTNEHMYSAALCSWRHIESPVCSSVRLKTLLRGQLQNKNKKWKAAQFTCRCWESCITIMLV